MNGEFQRYILFLISVLWLAVYQLNQKDACINNENRYRETIIIQLRGLRDNPVDNKPVKTARCTRKKDNKRQKEEIPTNNRNRYAKLMS